MQINLSRKRITVSMQYVSANPQNLEIRQSQSFNATKPSSVLQVTKTGITAFNSTKYAISRLCPFLVIRYCLRAFPRTNSQLEPMSPCFSKRLSSGYIVDAPKCIPNFLCTAFKMAQPYRPRSDVSFMRLSRMLSRMAPWKIFCSKYFSFLEQFKLNITNIKSDD